MSQSTEAMTPRQRWLAAMRLQPVDRLPFWPKLDAAYARAQAAPFVDWTNDRIHEWIGSDRHVGLPGCVRDVRTRTSVERRRDGDRHVTTFTAPGGTAALVNRFDPGSQSWHPVEFPVRSAEDIAIMTEVFTDVRPELDAEGLARARQAEEEIGEDAVTTNGVGESPLMYWVEWLAGVANAHYLLADCPEAVEGLFDAIHRHLLARTEILCAHSPADLLYFIENTSTTLISPAQYRRYCKRHLGEYAAVARGHDRLVVLHMCGHLKALLADLNDLPVAAFEAYTTPTVGNTTLADGRSACADKCLVGGSNAALWTRPADEITAGLAEQLAPLPHHRGLVVTSAGVMPPLCPPEIIREVCHWVRQYPARM